MRNQPHSHGEGVNILIKCIQQKDRLNNHVIHTVNIELDLCPAIAMPQA
jgi:hypothetical protein